MLFKVPKRIILLRHGESLGNVDDTSYANIPDWKIPLTRRGERQALHAAKDLSNLLKGESIFCYCSPYKRATETWQIMQESEYLNDIQVVGTREEPRIAEQQFGNFQVRTKKNEQMNESMQRILRLFGVYDRCCTVFKGLESSLESSLY
jgi:broad specificity phosphatase PhoE